MNCPACAIRSEDSPPSHAPGIPAFGVPMASTGKVADVFVGLALIHNSRERAFDFCSTVAIVVAFSASIAAGLVRLCATLIPSDFCLQFAWSTLS